MTSALDTAVEKMTELEAEIAKTSAKARAAENKWTLLASLRKVARYVDETDPDVRRLRIEPEIDQLIGLYKNLGLSELIQLETTQAFGILLQAASANLSAHGVDPIRALRVVILDLAVGRQRLCPREYQIDQWARTLVGERCDWMVFAYLDGVRFQGDFRHNEYNFSSSSRALEPSDEGDYPKSEPHAAVHLSNSNVPPPVYPATSASEIYEKLYQLTVCLQLYTGRAVRLLMTHLRPYGTSSRDHLYKHWITEQSLLVECHSVVSEEYAPLGKMLDRILPVLEDLRVRPDAYGKDYREIAVKHYSDSLLRSDPLEKVSLAVVSLEAVYGLGRMELQYN